MDINIIGAGSVTTGDYENISISGSGRITGPVRCAGLQCSGSVSAQGKIECAGAARFSGSVRLDGALEAGSVAVSGSVSCASVAAQRDVHIAGAARVGGGISGAGEALLNPLRRYVAANAFVREIPLMRWRPQSAEMSRGLRPQTFCV